MALKGPCFRKIYAPQAVIWEKKRAKKAVSKHFLETFVKKIAFFSGKHPLEIKI